MKSVFLIKSPLQLLNAIEAKHHFNLKKEDCVLIVMGDRKSQPQILKLARHMDEWGVEIILNESPLFIGDPFTKKSISSFKMCCMGFLRKSFFNVRRLNKIKKTLGEVEYIFVGYPRYVYMRHFINVLPHKEVYLLDDGNATIRLAKERMEGTLNVVSGLKRKLKLFSKRFFQRVKDKEKESLGFFTIYNVVAGNADKIVKNDFSYIRSRIESLDLTNDVYFVGSPLSETGIVSQKEYIDSLKKVKEYFPDNRLVYIVHRRENAAKLEVISRELGLETVLFDYPVEYQLAMIGPRPVCLVSFFSSALDSCGLIFGSAMRIIAFELDLEASPRRLEVEAVYNNYRTNKEVDIHVEPL